MPDTRKKIDVIIVDDEKEARENLNDFLNEYAQADVRVVGFAQSGKEAELKIAELAPDAIFLDIEMPNENAFEFLERMQPVSFEVVFVTAYDEHALKAFKLNAVDYILKPISIQELCAAVDKLRERIAYRKLMKSTGVSFAEVNKVATQKSKGSRIVLKDGGSVDVVEFSDILFLEAQGSYSRVVFRAADAEREKIMSAPLSSYEELLPDDIFFRVHKSFIINCNYVGQLIKDDSAHVALSGGHTIPVGRRRINSLVSFLHDKGKHEA